MKITAIILVAVFGIVAATAPLPDLEDREDRELGEYWDGKKVYWEGKRKYYNCYKTCKDDRGYKHCEYWEGGYYGSKSWSWDDDDCESSDDNCYFLSSDEDSSEVDSIRSEDSYDDCKDECDKYCDLKNRYKGSRCREKCEDECIDDFCYRRESCEFLSKDDSSDSTEISELTSESSSDDCRDLCDHYCDDMNRSSRCREKCEDECFDDFCKDDDDCEHYHDECCDCVDHRCDDGGYYRRKNCIVDKCRGDCKDAAEECSGYKRSQWKKYQERECDDGLDW